MKQTFKILTIEEENKLTKEELKGYYINLRNYLAARKLTNTSFGATTIAPRIKNVNKYLSKLGIKMYNRQDIHITSEGLENVPTERVLFVHRYDNILESLVMNINNERHCLTISSKEKYELLLLCQLSNGIISKKKDNETNKNNVKLDAIRLLLEGKSIACFAEKSSNYCPIEIYDFLEIAQKAGVAVIPVLHKYFFNKPFLITTSIEKIHIVYGSPIYIDEYDNIYEKIEEYETAIFNMSKELSQSTEQTKKRVLNN